MTGSPRNIHMVDIDKVGAELQLKFKHNEAQKVHYSYNCLELSFDFISTYYEIVQMLDT